MIGAMFLGLALAAGPAMVRMPGGSFTLGRDDGPADERPGHRVTVGAFELDRLPVTNAEFARFLDAAGPANARGENLFDADDPDARIHRQGAQWRPDPGYEDHPVVEVSWAGARDYCAWTGRRLPTEAEWEYAARGSDGRRYPWGSQPPDATRARFGAPFNATAPAGGFPAGGSPFGVLGMAGNVWQWVSSAYRPYPYRADDGREELADVTVERVTRGGGHDSPAADLTATHRGRHVSRPPGRATTTSGSAAPGKSAVDADLLRRKTAAFVLWRPAVTAPPPRLVIGELQAGNPPALTAERSLPLRPAGGDLWELPAAECGLVDGRVYHYWFEVTDANPAKAAHPRIRCTDPTAWTVDWRLLAPRLPSPFDEDDRDPAGVLKWEAGRLVPCDPAGEVPDWSGDPALDRLPTNHRLVLYELPTAWSRLATPDGHAEVSVGTFRDVAALVEATDPAGHPAPDHLRRLGVNALELLPPADSFVDREWGYATSNYFAPDYDLGFPEGHASPTASVDLARLIVLCHRHGIRFFADVVMAFATRYAYQNVNFLDFHVQSGAGDPEEWAGGRRRDGFGGDLFKYNYRVTGYDPLAGDTRSLVPARRLMQAFLVRWMRDFRVDGLRLDSVENIASWDFVGEFKDLARQVWRERWAAQGLAAGDADARFLVVGEELAVPLALLEQGRLDGLWNEHFKRLVRHAILGETDEQEPSFEWTIRKLIDCRLLGFADGTQAVNYVTSHDVGGFRNERLQNFLNANGVVETEQRIKLAFVCLLTAVGVPMILAGEEFADEHDLPVRHPEKQVDPVNFDRLADAWRRRLFRYVARLVRLRTTADALSVNDTRFLHADFTEGKRVVVWQRGQAGSGRLVVVVANFSAFGTPGAPGPVAEYVVPGWPATPPGRRWREVTQDREVAPEWVGREPVFPWEAKVYTLA